MGSRGLGLWQRMFWLKIPVITGSHPLPETSVAVSEEDKANEDRAAVLWGSAEDGKEDLRQPLASGPTWADLVPQHQMLALLPIPPQQRADLLLITRLPGLLGAAGPAFLTRLGASSIVYDPATLLCPSCLPGQHL